MAARLSGYSREARQLAGANEKGVTPLPGHGLRGIASNTVTNKHYEALRGLRHERCIVQELSVHLEDSAVDSAAVNLNEHMK